MCALKTLLSKLYKKVYVLATVQVGGGTKTQRSAPTLKEGTPKIFTLRNYPTLNPGATINQGEILL